MNQAGHSRAMLAFYRYNITVASYSDQCFLQCGTVLAQNLFQFGSDISLGIPDSPAD